MSVPVVLVHGALRSRAGLWPTARMLRKHGLVPSTFGYATRTDTLEQHARRLDAHVAKLVAGAPPSILGFLTHSMGGLVVRKYLSRPAALPAERVRVVMLSPPNRGAALAQNFRDFPPFHWLYGEAASELQPDQAAKLAPLPAGVEVLVLAGGRGDDRGFNPRIDGDDDGVVAVADMPLEGHAFHFVGGGHSRLQYRGDVLERAAGFLRGE